MDKATRESLARRTLELSRADQTEVLISHNDAALTRFAHETVTQNVAACDTAVSVRTIVDGKTGVARTNLLCESSLRAVVERALAMTALVPSDPLTPVLPSGAPTAVPAGAYDPATAHAGAGLRARMCDAIFGRAEETGCWCAGYVSTSAARITLANTSGALASFDLTDAGINVKMNAADSSGFAEFYSNAVAAIDAAECGATAARKAGSSASPRAVEPGSWTVILEPPAFGELVSYLTDHFSAQSFDDGSSFCSDGLDRAYFAENVTLYDDYAHPLAPGMPFDYEGQPKQRVTLVEGGIVRNVVTDSYYARKLERANTGHALPAPNAYGPQALNVVVAHGTKSTAELLAETKRGLLVTRFWYIRTVDQKKALVTGMTRDGTFLIENGRIACGVRNMRFNASILELLRRCEFSSEQRRTCGYDYSIVVPAAKIDGFTFTSVTEF
jgi:PmbA protein